MTVAVGASLFDDRFGIAPLKPRHLITMEQFPNDALDRKSCHGDLMLQILLQHLGNQYPRAAGRDQESSRPFGAALESLMAFCRRIRSSGPARTPVRNLLGFKDGTANLAVSDSALMERMVWVQPASDEPAWTAGGSYQVVRIIRNLVERWDRTPLAEQQRIIGRNKMSGAPLGMNSEHDVPAYASNPQDESIARDGAYPACQSTE